MFLSLKFISQFILQLEFYNIDNLMALSIMALIVEPDEMIKLILQISQSKDRRKKENISAKTFQKWVDNGITYSLIFGSSFRLFTIAESLVHNSVCKWFCLIWFSCTYEWVLTYVLEISSVKWNQNHSYFYVHLDSVTIHFISLQTCASWC